VHMDNHPQMIDPRPRLQAHTMLESRPWLQAQTILERTEP
jgi:hypothetical protein